ncbi:hypothetical protein F5884DRAFT_899986 [Xylogone sp. PMI_703]|nr:hypothetical protein F5884DRAFT_899986 [Xylogone sp. PMI_703]
MSTNSSRGIQTETVSEYIENDHNTKSCSVSEMLEAVKEIRDTQERIITFLYKRHSPDYDINQVASDLWINTGDAWDGSDDAFNGSRKSALGEDFLKRLVPWEKRYVPISQDTSSEWVDFTIESNFLNASKVFQNWVARSKEHSSP